MGIISLNCPNCGAQFNMDDSREFGYCNVCGSKVMIDRMVVEHTGHVKIDSTDELNNLYVLARRARDDGNSTNAQKYYEQIIIKAPSDWEANFYTVYYQSMNCKIAEIGLAAIRMTNCESTVFNLIKNNIHDYSEKKKAVEQVVAALISISLMLFSSYKEFYDGIDAMIKDRFVQQYANNCSLCRDILYLGGEEIISVFGEDFGALAAECWKVGVAQHNILNGVFNDKSSNAAVIKLYNERIKKYDSSYVAPRTNMSSDGGCYVATCVYGSYDCPQVWTLRRYRDDTLASTWYGRAFIRAYYAVSPTLVKGFGNTMWFKTMWQGKLDRMVKRLNAEGVADTPYSDKKW
ncbi:MAG: hypothetical protein IJU94_02785 [Clostridia bacterium]|nr:hypothetical protein [Clostridia bacterium]